MTQSGYALAISNSKWEDYASLHKDMKGYVNRVEYKREFAQVTTNGAVAIEEVSGETIAAMSASKVLEVWQKTDQVGTDGAAVGIVEWQTLAGLVTSATFALDGTATTTHAALVAAVTTGRHVRRFELTAINCADEVLIGNAAGTEVFGVIKVGYHQCLKSGFMGGLSRRSFIGKIKVHLSAVTAVVTLVCTYTPIGQTLSTTKTFITNSIEKTWEPALEIAAASAVSWTIIDDNAAHPTATMEFTYLEAY
jgi:hypothetical protein